MVNNGQWHADILSNTWLSWKVNLGLVETRQRTNCPFLHQTQKKIARVRQTASGVSLCFWTYWNMGIMKYKLQKVCHVKRQQNLWNQMRQFIALRTPPPPHGKTAPNGPGPLHHRGISTTLRHTTLSRSPLDKRSARSRDLYLTTHNAYKRQTSMPPAGFKPATPARQRPHTDTLDHAATGVGTLGFIINQ